MKEICVIGGSGFIGTRLCKRLMEHQKDFFIIDKKQSQTFSDKTVLCDVRNFDALKNTTPFALLYTS